MMNVFNNNKLFNNKYFILKIVVFFCFFIINNINKMNKINKYNKIIINLHIYYIKNTNTDIFFLIKSITL